MAEGEKAGFPKYIRRRLTAMVLASVGVGVVTPVVTLAAQGRVPTWAFVLAVGLPGAASGVIAGQAGVMLEKAKKRAKAAGGKVCWECGYSLEGIDGAGADGGVCPECGKAYEIRELRRLWWAPEVPPGA